MGMEKKKIGRNDPCHCGSGKKYKNCHFDEDRKNQKSVTFFPEKDVLSPTHKRLLGIRDTDLGKR